MNAKFSKTMAHCGALLLTTLLLSFNALGMAQPQQGFSQAPAVKEKRTHKTHKVSKVQKGEYFQPINQDQACLDSTGQGQACLDQTQQACPPPDCVQQIPRKTKFQRITTIRKLAGKIKRHRHHKKTDVVTVTTVKHDDWEKDACSGSEDSQKLVVKKPKKIKQQEEWIDVTDPTQQGQTGCRKSKMHQDRFEVGGDTRVYERRHRDHDEIVCSITETERPVVYYDEYTSSSEEDIPADLGPCQNDQTFCGDAQQN